MALTTVSAQHAANLYNTYKEARDTALARAARDLEIINRGKAEGWDTSAYEDRYSKQKANAAKYQAKMDEASKGMVQVNEQRAAQEAAEQAEINEAAERLKDEVKESLFQRQAPILEQKEIKRYRLVVTANKPYFPVSQEKATEIFYRCQAIAYKLTGWSIEAVNPLNDQQIEIYLQKSGSVAVVIVISVIVGIIALALGAFGVTWNLKEITGAKEQTVQTGQKTASQLAEQFSRDGEVTQTELELYKLYAGITEDNGESKTSIISEDIMSTVKTAVLGFLAIEALSVLTRKRR